MRGVYSELKALRRTDSFDDELGERLIKDWVEEGAHDYERYHRHATGIPSHEHFKGMLKLFNTPDACSVELFRGLVLPHAVRCEAGTLLPSKSFTSWATELGPAAKYLKLQKTLPPSHVRVMLLLEGGAERCIDVSKRYHSLKYGYEAEVVLPPGGLLVTERHKTRLAGVPILLLHVRFGPYRATDFVNLYNSIKHQRPYKEMLFWK